MESYFKKLQNNFVGGRNSPDIFNPNTDSLVGQMLAYVYIAKGRDTLPYWDMYPLVLPMNWTGDGWIGLNLHYLPPSLRLRLVDSISKNQARTKIDPKTGNIYTYMVGIQRMFSQLDPKLVKPCIKRYIFNQIKSRIVKIAPEDWRRVASMSLQNFQKASTSEIWSKVKL